MKSIQFGTIRYLNFSLKTAKLLIEWTMQFLKIYLPNMLRYVSKYLSVPLVPGLTNKSRNGPTYDLLCDSGELATLS